MKLDKRIVRNQISTQATMQILTTICNSPEKYADDVDLIKAIKSQGGLAKLEYEAQVQGERIHKLPMSLNTLKSYSDDIYEEGFEGLNHVRLKAVEALETYIHRSIKPDSQSRAGLKSKIHELEDELEKHRSVNFILLQAINSAMDSIISVQKAPNDSVRELRATEGLARIRAVASLNPHPFDKTQSSIVSLKDYKDEQ